MVSIQVHDKTFELLIPGSRIREKIRGMAARMNEDLKSERPLFISVLNGSFIFSADLFRELTIEVEICFTKLASYQGTASMGRTITSIGLDADLTGRTVVILEDIVDTGRTLHEFLPQLLQQGPKKLLISALLSKPAAQQFPVKIDYPGFSVPDKFLVGYGLDYDGLGRNLPDIYCLKQ